MSIKITPEMIEEHGITKSEYEKIKEILNREPNYTELGIFSVMWSEHCSYKNSKAVLKRFPTKGEQVIQGPGENAGIISIGGDDAITFKVESHNHPSAIEPYQGAATGVGGILRDIFTMGARPIAILNSLRFGKLDNKRTKYLFENVVAGIAGYGNCIGVPTVGGEIYFDESYAGNPLVNAMCVGYMKKDSMKLGIASGIGNPVMYVGAATGRDGIHGATMASKEFEEGKDSQRSAVQVGDPFMEKLLLEACLELFETDAVVGIQDMGAAGLTSSSAEMAGRAGNGIEIDITDVPQREKDMTPYEILLSESQERMLIVAKKGREEEIKKIFEKWDLHAVTIGKVTDDGMLRITNGDKVEVEIPALRISNDAPEYYREMKEPKYYKELKNYDMQAIKLPVDYNETLLNLLSTPNIASKKWVYEQYDHMVRTDTVVKPGKGDAAVLRLKNSKKGIALTIDCNSSYIYLDPYLGGKIAVAEAARNIACVGGKPLAITDGINFGNPEKPEIYWQFSNACDGISEACNILNTPVTGGNVSFYNEFNSKAIDPTPVIGMVGVLENVENHMTMDFKDKDDYIILLGENRDEIGGSEYLKSIHNIKAGEVPEVNLWKEKRLVDLTSDLIEADIIKSAHDCSEGGLAVNIAESCMLGEIGAEINLKAEFRKDSLYFGESQGRIVVTANKANKDRVIDKAIKKGLEARVIGKVGGDSIIINEDIHIKVEEAKDRFYSLKA